MTFDRKLLFAVCCCLALFLLPAAVHATPETPETAPAVSSVACGAQPDVLADFQQDPLQMSPCFISVTCSDGSSVSCNGNNSCNTSGTNNRCVTCDGVQQGCCPLTICEACEINYQICSQNCEFEFECNKCDNIYGRCLTRNNCPQ